MKVIATDQFGLPLPPGHTFPVEKYALLRQGVEAAGLVSRHDLRTPAAATEAQLALAHDPGYVRRASEGCLTDSEVREIGLPWSPALIERSRRSVGATIEAARWALREGVAVNLAGGTHHAGPAKGAGYCVFNDAAVAIRVLQAEGCIRRAVVIDCDVHHGDGTAAIFAADASVFSFSIHGAKNYPLRKPPSDLDVPLEDGIGDAEYLAALSNALPVVLDRAVADLAIYLAGADPFAGDRLGRLKLTQEGLSRRDALVLEACRARRLPVAVTMAGGYARVIADTVSIQVETVRRAWEAWRAWHFRDLRSSNPGFAT